MTKLFPPWLRVTLSSSEGLERLRKILQDCKTATVCDNALCPNRLECFTKSQLAFLALGTKCTRSCSFCNVAHAKKPLPPNQEEADNIVKAAKMLNLKHLIVTMVTRDDLPDQGANHMALIIKKAKTLLFDCSIEVLTSDFSGEKKLLDIVLTQKPHIFSHNLETVRRLSLKVRHKADYERSLFVLQEAKKSKNSLYIKSGIMVGLGESDTEVFATLKDLKIAGCDIVTIGQYLQPNPKKLPVKKFIPQEKFDLYKKMGKELGINHLFASPFTRSTYNSEEILSALKR